MMEMTFHLDTSISANADGPRDAASRKIDRIALHAECNYRAAALRAIFLNHIGIL